MLYPSVRVNIDGDQISQSWSTQVGYVITILLTDKNQADLRVVFQYYHERHKERWR